MHALFAFTAAVSAVPLQPGDLGDGRGAVASFPSTSSRGAARGGARRVCRGGVGPLAETRASVVAKLGGAGAVELSPVQREVMSRALIALRAAEGSAAPLAVSAVHVT